MKFTPTKIALAVGASLVAMAGVAQAAVSAPTVRATKPAMISSTADGATVQIDARALYDGTGYTGNLAITLNFAAPAASTTGAGGYQNYAKLDAGTDALLVNGVAASGTNTSFGLAGTADDISVTVTPVGGTALALPLTMRAIFNANTGGLTTADGVSGTATTTASATLSIAPKDSTTYPNGAFRMNAAGILQWIADINAPGAAGANWVNVDLAVKAPGGALGIMSLEDQFWVLHGFGPSTYSAASNASTGTASIAAVTSASIGNIWNTVAPKPIIGTHTNTAVVGSKPIGSIVDGVFIDTLTPVAVVFSAANVQVSTATVAQVAGVCAGVTNPNKDVAVTFGAAVATGANTLAASNIPTGVAARYPITMTSASTVTWTSLGATADAAAYDTTCFNTGVKSAAGLPLQVNVNALTPAYSFVFDKAGAAVSVATISSTTLAVLDAAPPVLVSAATDASAKTLSLTFSEPLKFISANSTTTGNAGDLREIAENVLVGATNDSLAALNLNYGGSLTVTGAAAISSSKGQGILTILDNSSALATYAAGKAITVKPGIAVRETNDGSYSTVVQTLDNTAGAGSLSGGVSSANQSTDELVTEGSQTVTAAAASITSFAFNDSTITAIASTQTISDRISLITVTFPTGKGVGYASGMTFADLTGEIVVTVDGVNAIGKPASFQFFPTAITSGAGTPAAGQMILSTSAAAAGNTMKIGLPTDLVYKDLVTLTGVTVQYQLVSSRSVLAGTGTPAATVTAGTALAVALPLNALTASATTSTLFTERVTGGLTPAPQPGALVKAWLAKWIDQPVADPATTSTTIKSGKITSTGDKVATDIALEFVASTTGTSGVAQVNGDDLGAAIQVALRKAAPAVAAAPGVAEAKAEIKAPTIPVYIKLVRSSETTGSSKAAQNYLEARAFISSTLAGARLAMGFGDKMSNASAPNAANEDPVYECTLDPTTGKITGRLEGSIVTSTTTGIKTERGLYFINKSGDLKKYAATTDSGTATLPDSTSSTDSAGVLASGMVGSGAPGITTALVGATGAANGFNLLVGVDPKTNTQRNNLQNTFLLVELEENPPASAAQQVVTRTLLTSAEPGAANFLPFVPDVFGTSYPTGTGNGSGKATVLSNTLSPPVAPALVGLPGGAFDTSRITKVGLQDSTGWALYGMGSPDRSATPAGSLLSIPRAFVGLDLKTGNPTSYWTNDTGTSDMALAMAGNKVSVATEGAAPPAGTYWNVPDTLSNIAPSSFVAKAVALAQANDVIARKYGSPSTLLRDALFVQQTTPAIAVGAVILPVGWSLINVPAAGLSAAGVGVAAIEGVVKVGAQATTQSTWFKTDGTALSTVLGAGDTAFVFAKTGGKL